MAVCVSIVVCRTMLFTPQKTTDISYYRGQKRQTIIESVDRETGGSPWDCESQYSVGRGCRYR